MLWTNLQQWVYLQWWAHWHDLQLWVYLPDLKLRAYCVEPPQLALDPKTFGCNNILVRGY